MTDALSGAAPPVPLASPARAWPEIRAEAIAVFDRLAAAGDFSLGEELERFEDEFAQYCDVRHCVGTSDGTQALRLALTALGAGPGTSVVAPASTFVATVEAIAMTGARPLLVDIDPSTRCMDPAALAGAVRPDTVAVVPVHLYGRPAPVEAIRTACPSGVAIVEDAAQAHGARLGGRRVGSLGHAAAFSFYPTKNLGALGDGGAVVTEDEAVAAQVRSLRHHGCAPDDPNRHVRPGMTARLDNIQAAFLRIKLPRLERWNQERRDAAALHREALAGLPLEAPPGDPPDGIHVQHLFVVLVDDRDRVLRDLHAEGIVAGAHYPLPVHLQPGWSSLGYGPGDFPEAERLAARCLSLPLFPGIEAREIERVATALSRVVGAG